MYLDEMCWLFVSSFFFFFSIFLQWFWRITFAIIYYQLISVCWDLRSSLQRVGNNKNVLYHCWIFMNLFYILYIYTICEKKIEIKVVFFIFFKFSRMLCWKNYEIFSWRIMMNIMPIITDLLKKMGYFF